jgi:hypothetical protein
MAAVVAADGVATVADSGAGLQLASSAVVMASAHKDKRMEKSSEIKQRKVVIIHFLAATA